ncbi:MAG: nuclear transport factor 2 family protein [Pseudolabrys sp.]
MSSGTDRAQVEAFYLALCKQDYDAIESMLDDNVEWSFSGPVEALPFCGTYHGKKQVRHVLEHKIAETLGKRTIVADMFLVDAGRGALLGRLIGKLPNGQTISYRIAQFFKMQGGKVREHRTVLDTFDAVEQVTGRRIPLAPSQPRDQAEDSVYPV